MRGGDGGAGPTGPQPAPVYATGTEGRPPREERAKIQSLPAAGGADLLQKVQYSQALGFQPGEMISHRNTMSAVESFEISLHIFCYILHGIE